MRWFLLACLGWVMACRADPELHRLIDFEQYRFGVPPKEFEYTATGPHGPVLSAGRPLWRTYVDLSAPSPKFVLLQASALAASDHYPLALVRDVELRDVKLAVSVKVIGGKLSGAAGCVLRAQDKNNYAAVLLDSMAQRVRLVRMVDAHPKELASARINIDPGQWNKVEVIAQENEFAVWLNDRAALSAQDSTMMAAGRVGLLTHADTLAEFDDFYIQNGPGRVVLGLSK